MITLAKSIHKDKAKGIQAMIDDGSINHVNYAASFAKLERLAKEKSDEKSKS